MSDQPARCGRCGAALPEGATWCPLCYHDVVPAGLGAAADLSALPPPAAAAAEGAAATGGVGLPDPGAPQAAGDRATGPQPAVDLADGEVGGALDDATVAAMLAGLEEHERGTRVRVPGPGGVRGKALAFGIGVGVMAAVLLLASAVFVMLGG